MQPGQDIPQTSPRPFRGDIMPPNNAVQHQAAPSASGPYDAPVTPSAPVNPYAQVIPAPAPTPQISTMQPTPQAPAPPSPVPAAAQPQASHFNASPMAPTMDGMLPGPSAAQSQNGGYAYYSRPSQPVAPAPNFSTPPQPISHSAPTAAPSSGSAFMPPAPPPAQIVDTIPLKAPSYSPKPTLSSAPAVGGQASVPLQPPSMDEASRIEQILKDVNGAVGAPEQKTKSGRLSLAKPNLKQVSPKLKAASHVLSKPTLPLGVAVLICVGLVAASYFAFGKNQTPVPAAQAVHRVGTSSAASESIKAGGGTLVSPADIDDFSKTAQSQINGLNDDQDFNNTDLSDHTLGL